MRTMPRFKLISYTLASIALVFAFGCADEPDSNPIDGEDSKLGPSEKGNIPGGGTSIGGSGTGGGGGGDENNISAPTAPEEVGQNPEDPNLPTRQGDFDPVTSGGRCDHRIFGLDAMGTQTLLAGADTTFNARGELQRRVSADESVVESFTYGAGNRLTAYTRTEGESSSSIEWDYDANGRLIERVTSSGDEVTESITYTYDREGRLATRAVSTGGEEPDVFLFAYPDLRTRRMFRDSDGDGAYTEGADALVLDTVYFIDGRLDRTLPVAGDPGVSAAHQYNLSQRWSGVKNVNAENEAQPGGFAFVEGSDAQLATIRPWTFEFNGQLDGVTVRDRGEISRSSSGNITLLEVYGSSLDTPVARVEFDGLQCDRTRQEWLDLTREVLMLACDSEGPCERVN